jgi:hypothetical protein
MSWYALPIRWLCLVKRLVGGCLHSCCFDFFKQSGPPPTQSFMDIFRGFRSMFLSPNNPESTLKVIIVVITKRGTLPWAGAKTALAPQYLMQAHEFPEHGPVVRAGSSTSSCYRAPDLNRSSHLSAPRLSGATACCSAMSGARQHCSPVVKATRA